MNANKKYFLLTLLCLFQWGCLTKADIDPNVYTLSGTLTMETLNDFEQKVKSVPIRTVVFKECVGGNLLAAIRIAQKIKENNIKTVLSGLAASGCAYAYLAGAVRHTDALNAENVVVFHGGFNGRTEPSGAIKNQEYLDLYAKLIGYKFSKIPADIILNTKKPLEGIYFVQLASSTGSQSYTFYCDGENQPGYENCQKLDGITLESEGIVTK